MIWKGAKGHEEKLESMVAGGRYQSNQNGSADLCGEYRHGGRAVISGLEDGYLGIDFGRHPESGYIRGRSAGTGGVMKLFVFGFLGVLFVVGVLLMFSAVKEEDELYELLEDKDDRKHNNSRI